MWEGKFGHACRGQKEKCRSERAHLESLKVERSGIQEQIIEVGEVFWVGRGSHGDGERYSWPERPGAD